MRIRLHLERIFSPLALHMAALPADVTDKQTGYSKVAAISVQDHSGSSVLPSLSAQQTFTWQEQTSDFTHVVNTLITESSAVSLTHQAFCASTLNSGHFLIDLFGLSNAHCQAVMMHYKLLKLQTPSISAHFVLPAVKHFHSAYKKPDGLLMQTIEQFKRGRRKAMLLFNPPVVQRRDIPSTGLSSVFQVGLAGTPARALVDTGAEISFMDSSFAKRSGFHVVSSPSTPSIQLANGQQLQSTGQVSTSMQLPGYTGAFSALVADLGHLSCDIILGDAWLRLHHGCIKFGPSGAESLAIRKGSKKLLLKPLQQSTASGIHTIELNAIRMSNQLKRRKAVKCFAVKVTAPAGEAAEVASSDGSSANPHLVPQADIDALKLEFDDVFQSPPDGLPPDRGTGHLIPLLPDHKAPYRNPYRLSLLEIAEVKKQIEELLRKGWIEESSSPYGASILFVQKKDGSLRMCIDYRALNQLTVKDRSPLPRIDDLLSQMNGATVFSSLDLAQGYHQIRIAQEDIPKTGFTTPFGHYQFKVMCFGLTNAPGTFQKVMNRLFHKSMHKYVVVYLDDILISSKTPEEHLIHLREVLSILRNNKLFAKLSKCDLNMPQVLYLGHIVSKDGLQVDPKKVAAVQDWPVPKDLHELRCFLGLTNYFRTFIQGYSKRVLPLTRLQSPKRAFVWDESCQQAFLGVKHDLIHAPVLASPDLHAPFEMVTDACDEGIGAVLLQDRRPVAFESRKLIPAELNYTTTEKECLAVIHALKVWRCYLEGQPKEHFTIVTDHNPLIHLPKQPTLSRRMARWSGYLQRFTFNWEYRPGRINVADPISRRPSDQYPVTTINVLTRSLKSTASQPLVPASNDIMVEASDPNHGAVSDVSALREEIIQGYKVDPWFADTANVASLVARQGLYFHENAVVIPDHADLRKKLLHEFHNTPCAGHLGVNRTTQLMIKDYWWPKLRDDVLSHVRTCGSCQRNKGATQRPYGEAMPLHVPDYQWKEISMDFITHLPPTRLGHTAILVVVDRLTKMVHFLPTFDTASAEETAALFRDRIFVLHGMPQVLLSDRDVKFTSAFWKELHRLLGITLSMSTAYHPQTDGQTERMNRVLEDMLRHFINHSHNDWEQFLAPAEFAINNAVNSSVQNTPFMLNYGRHPWLPVNMVGHLRDTKLWQKDERVPAANVFIDNIQKSITLAKQCMQRAQDRQGKFAAHKARPHSFTPGMRVLLSSKNIKLRSSGTPKLQPRWLGPFKLIKMVGTQAAELELPSTMKIHDVFHVSLLKPFHSQPGEVANPPVVYADGDQEFDVGYIRSHRGSKRYQEYLVHWEGYGPEHDSWEPATALRNSPAAVKTYWAKQQLKADSE